MKKLIKILILFLICVFLSAVGCGDKPQQKESNMGEQEAEGMDEMGEAEEIEETTESQVSSNGVDVDLTELTSTMVYSEVYQMMIAPEDYLGKTVKMNGSFTVFENQETGQLYYACVILDATACCSQGIEFVLEGDYTYPDDYPEENENITVTGIFNTYEENGYTYCQLINAKMDIGAGK
ncbi:MAG: hypothetical protein ACI4ES_03200 [Roseburia sp.]